MNPISRAPRSGLVRRFCVLRYQITVAMIVGWVDWVRSLYFARRARGWYDDSMHCAAIDDLDGCRGQAAFTLKTSPDDSKYACIHYRFHGMGQPAA
jgi:hypothetical protein